MQKAKRWAISKMAVVDGELVTETGVGCAFEAWVRDEDGALCKPGIVEAPAGRSGPDPGGDGAQKAAVVLHLKEEQGLGNSDPEVSRRRLLLRPRHRPR